MSGWGGEAGILEDKPEGTHRAGLNSSQLQPQWARGGGDVGGLEARTSPSPADQL